MNILKKPDFDFRCHQNVFYNHLFLVIISAVLFSIYSFVYPWITISFVSKNGEEGLKISLIINTILGFICIAIILGLSIFIRYIDINVENDMNKQKQLYKNWSIVFDVATIFILIGFVITIILLRFI